MIEDPFFVHFFQSHRLLKSHRRLHLGSITSGQRGICFLSRPFFAPCLCHDVRLAPCLSSGVILVQYNNNIFNSSIQLLGFILTNQEAEGTTQGSNMFKLKVTWQGFLPVPISYSKTPLLTIASTRKLSWYPHISHNLLLRVALVWMQQHHAWFTYLYLSLSLSWWLVVFNSMWVTTKG